LKKTIQQDDSLEHFIPVSRSDLINDLCSLPQLSNSFILQFKQFCKLYIAVFHAQFQQQHSLIDDYLPFSPDRDTISKNSKTPQQYKQLQDRLFEDLQTTLLKANFISLSEQQLNTALNKTSPYGVEVSVDFDVFDEIKIFTRGLSSHSKIKRTWQSLFLKKIDIEVKTYRRLFILLKIKTLEKQIKELQTHSKLTYQQAKRKITKKRDSLPEDLNDQLIFIKLFKDIPQSDLEMLFPNSRVRMRLFDKIRLSITGGGGTIGGFIATAGKIAATIDPITIAIALSGFAGVLWRQISSIFTQRTKYMAALSQHLYYYNMDNNRGALAHITELAEAEECKEAILSYFFLLQHKSLTADDLDQLIEKFMQEHYSINMDFEVSDGIQKLKEMDLLQINQSDSEQLAAIPMTSAENSLKLIWNKII
jgi:Protein of unknown function (DUF3754)